MKPFEFDGQKYQKASTHQKEWGSRLISKLNLKGNETILDLGCGDGGLTKQLALSVPEGTVLGIDASIGMIETAKKNKLENLKFNQMNINEMHFQNQFNIIFSNAALHWIKDHKRLLNHSYQALKQEGILLWEFAGDGNCSNFYEIVKCKIIEDKWSNYFVGFEWPWFMPTKSQYETLMTTSSFSNIEVTTLNKDRYFPTVDAMIKWIDQPSLVPFLAYLPTDTLKLDFRQEVIEEMIRKTKHPDGTCFETFRRLRVYAQK